MHSLHTLLRGLVDYAGLFPPAGLPMAAAVESFAEYRRSEHAWVLGRFVVPASRLEELEVAAEGVLPVAGEPPWGLSVLAGPDPAATAAAIGAQRRRPAAARLTVQAVETRAGSAAEIRRALEQLSGDLEVFVEIPFDEDPAPLVAALAGTGGRAKVRTGGVTADAFPTPPQLARFLRACAAESVPFKATAGLHHPLHGSYRLTYDPGSPRGTMFGFLNVFLAAASLSAGELAEDELLALLVEEDPAAFAFSEAAVRWRDRRLSAGELAASRGRFALSYGSCSFLEPIEDLQGLNLL